MIKIAEAVSRIRAVLKFTKEDTFVTDRVIYSVISKYSKLALKKLEKEGKLFVNDDLFTEIPCLELTEVSLLEACCTDVRTSCKIVRTKNKLPKIFNTGSGHAISYVTSIDGSTLLVQTHPRIYSAMSKSTNFRFNKSNYYWVINEYMYFPNLLWEGVKVSALWEEDISNYQCNNEECACNPVQENEITTPEYLFAEIDNMVIQELFTMYKVPSDINDDKINPAR